MNGVSLRLLVGRDDEALDREATNSPPIAVTRYSATAATSGVNDPRAEAIAREAPSRQTTSEDRARPECESRRPCTTRRR